MLYTADFETTTDPEDCRVWAVGLCNVKDTNDFTYYNNMESFMSWCAKMVNPTLYFHNLKFDGEFIISWLFDHGFKHVKDKKQLETKTFTTLISDKGQFYSVEICFYRLGKNKISTTIYDSLKILPFSVSEIAKGFNLPIEKEVIDYDKPRPIGYELDKDEIHYLKNDCEIVARALSILFEQGLNKMTQGSNALYDYKRTVTIKNFKRWFPIPNYDSDVRKSYKGGFTYLNPKYAEMDIGEGIVLDVNSLYPSVMYYDKLPYGEGIYFEGKYEKDDLYNLYTQTLTCQFEIKEGHIPTIQLKNNLSFVPNQYLESSGDEEVTLTLTSVDLELFFDHYNVYNIEWHDGWKFKSTDKLFKDYIDKWITIKIESTKKGNKAMRTLAKLMLNALYGKFALNPRVQSKIPYKDDGIVKYMMGEEEERNPIYIPVGTFVTAYARNKTIRSAQQVYDRFIYADTDSLHLIGTDMPEGLEIDDTALGAWAHEGTFVRGKYLRQKSYIEEMKTSTTFYLPELNTYGNTSIEITCAGMPTRCYKNVTWENYKIGESFEGKLQMTHVKGGIVLKDVDFTLKR